MFFNYLKTTCLLLSVIASLYTNAATYYTRGSGGNWSSTSTWSTAGNNGAAASAVPGASDNIIISHSNGSGAVIITVNGNYSCNNVTVGTGSADAKLQITSNLYTLTIGGSLTFNTSNSGNTCTLDIGPGTCTVTGSINWASTSAVTTEVINVTSGTLSLSYALVMPKGSGTLRVTSTGTVNFNSGSTPSATVNSGIFGTAAVLSAASGSTLSFKNGFANGTALAFDNGSTQKFIGNGTITTTATTTFGNIIINSGATVGLNGDITVQNNWTDDGGFNGGMHTVTFSGTNQSITKSTEETFYNVVLNNAAGTLTLHNDFIIVNSLTMGGQNINLNSHTLQLGNILTSNLSRTAGIAYGGTFKRFWPLSLAINATSGQYFGLFPVGTATSYRPVEISATVALTVAGFVWVTHTPSLSVTDMLFYDGLVAVDRVSNEVSTIGTIGIGGGIFNVNMTFDDFSSMGTVNDLRLSKSSFFIASHAATSGAPNNPTCKRTGVLGAQLAGTYAAATKAKSQTPIQNNTPLPIQLTDFDAEADEYAGIVKINWQTVTEENNDHFTIERSIDGINFESIEVIPGAGNSNATIDYIITDEKPYNGYSYYRLKQTDFNGSYTHSTLITVYFDAKTEKISLYPNPASAGYTNVLIPLSLRGADMQINIYTPEGALVYTHKPKGNDIINGSYKFEHNLKPGIYIVNMGNLSNEYSARMVVI